MVSFGHGMFYGLGAYSFALLMQRAGMPIPPPSSLRCDVRRLGLVVGAICVRLKEIYFAFLTLAFQMLVHSVIILWVPLTGGDQGCAASRAALSRHQSRQPDAPVLDKLHAARRRPGDDASPRAVAVRLHAADDPRQRRADEFSRRRGVSRPADRFRPAGVFAGMGG
jgi:hypothetical protein